MKDMMLNYYKHIALPACLALVFGMPLTVKAQSTEHSPPEQQGSMTEPDAGSELDAKTKEKFVVAYVEIKQIQQKYTDKLQNVSEEAQARELQEQAQAEMVEVVENNDMTVHKYNQVVGAISSDPELRQEIEQMAQERTSQSSWIEPESD